MILLATPESVSTLSVSALSPLTNNSTATLLSAAVDSLPGSKGSNGARTTGYSWMITDQTLPIRFQTDSKSCRSLTFSLPNAKFSLALANTVFQNGQQSTVVHIPATARPAVVEAKIGMTDAEVEEFAHAQEDIIDAWRELGELMEVVGQKAGLSSDTPFPANGVEVQVSEDVLQTNGKNCATKRKFYSRLPLKPLTMPRKILDGMGNILRKLESTDGEPTGASRELEKAVANYIDNLPDDVDRPERVNVFARLTIQELHTDAVELFLNPGTRLHRVLSGGGGWGSKAGLLSLDPQGDVDVPGFEHEFEAWYDGKNVQHNGIVKQGQWVQFFAAEDGAPVEKGLQFGAVGKVEDVRFLEAPNSGEEITFEGCFGASSEGGVNVRIAGTVKKLDVPGGALVIGV